MKQPASSATTYTQWFRVITVILVLFGLLFFFFGFKIFSGQKMTMIPLDVLLPWESALYGAVLIGWGVTLLLVGRIAFRQKSRELKQALCIGLAIWLIVEAVASARFGVWVNVGVDAVVLTLFAVPLLRSR